MIVAIHQPQYLPWLGYLDKLDRADIFIFLDNVQYKKNEWQNRNRVKTAQGWQWVTVPILHRFPQRIDQVRPDLVLVNFYDDTHQDHHNLAQATLSATRHIRSVLFYEVPTTQNFHPNVFVDIGPVLEEKLKALKAHLSQVMKTNVEGLSILDVAQSTATFRGIQGRVRYAEAFASLRLILEQ